MFRGASVVLGIGLIILWIAGLSSHAMHGAWLPWLDGVAGLVAIGIGVSIGKEMGIGVAGWGLMALGLFILWIIGLASAAPVWLAWWTFGFACAFVILAASATSGGERLRHRTA
jgi:hypothetical protein